MEIAMTQPAQPTPKEQETLLADFFATHQYVGDAPSYDEETELDDDDE